MKQYTFNKYGKTFKRINRKQAERAYKNNLRILICPCNVRPDIFWRPYGDYYMPVSGIEFETLLNAWEFYNLTCPEVGRYAAFYIPVVTVDGIEQYDYSFLPGKVNA